MNIRRRGFSLLELLIAMAMSAMLALALYSAMRVALRARDSAARAVEPARAVQIASDLVRQEFESVLPPTGIFSGQFIGMHQAGVSGDADIVQFYAIGADEGTNDLPMSEGIRRVELAVRTDVNPPVLVRRVTRNLLPTVTTAEEEILCRNVRTFSLRYFDGSGWQDNWDSTTVGDVLPTAIAVIIEIGDATPTPTSAPPRQITRVIPLACARPVSTLNLEAAYDARIP